MNLDCDHYINNSSALREVSRAPGRFWSLDPSQASQLCCSCSVSHHFVLQHLCRHWALSPLDLPAGPLLLPRSHPWEYRWVRPDSPSALTASTRATATPTATLSSSTSSASRGTCWRTHAWHPGFSLTLGAPLQATHCGLCPSPGCSMKGLDGQQGPVYVGTGCFFRRKALYGYLPPHSSARTKTRSSCLSSLCNLCCCCLFRRRSSLSSNGGVTGEAPCY